MKSPSRFLKRISTKGYILIAGFIAIASLATYSNWQSHQQLAAEQARQMTDEKAQLAELSANKDKTDDLRQLEESEIKTEVTATETATNETAARPDASTKPGDVIGSNNTKRAKTFYGGPLVFNPKIVTVSRTLTKPTIVVSAMDGTAINPPTTYWDSSSGIDVTVDTSKVGSLAGQHASWPMILDASGLKPGTYVLELVANTKDDMSTIEYSGKVTVVVLP